MKIFFDTEFIDLGNTVLPISIGLVREDGKTYYAEVFDTVSHYNRALNDALWNLKMYQYLQDLDSEEPVK